MSQNGHAEVHPAPTGATAMVFGVGVLPAGHWFGLHEHPQHQIAWASRGVLAVEVDDSRWVLPPTRALWIPAGIAHRTGTSDGAAMRGIFLDPGRCAVDFGAPTMLRVTRLLHELFDLLTTADTTRERRARAEAVVFDLLEPVEVIPIGAHPPTDPRARQVADALAADPADPRTLAEFAAHVAASPRTLARLFVSETGLGFAHWRTQIRLAASLPLLAEGLPIARIAGRVGYGTPSAYVAAFRRAVGVPPGRYFSG
ncbi:AraC family transcriptional regulator [Nocardia sputorum]|uniref:AraC family transcriptional regulator n=1 Tax=Nocardia TaxID=1817 RepID=UPI002493C1CF|nr:helix-turn-helix transcriptional regulator [Nocardia sputorum]BDT90140.1 AraC family transcriptional regulator [Nocardia sputorum]